MLPKLASNLGTPSFSLLIPGIMGVCQFTWSLLVCSFVLVLCFPDRVPLWSPGWP